MTNSRLFLKKYKNKIRIDDQMRIYNRQFKNIFVKLIQWKQLNIYTQCSWYLQNFFDFYRIKFMRKHNFNFLNAKIMTFEIIYKIVIVMTNINDVLYKLNVLNFKKSQNNNFFFFFFLIHIRFNILYEFMRVLYNCVVAALTLRRLFHLYIFSTVMYWEILHSRTLWIKSFLFFRWFRCLKLIQQICY